MIWKMVLRYRPFGRFDAVEQKHRQSFLTSFLMRICRFWCEMMPCFWAVYAKNPNGRLYFIQYKANKISSKSAFLLFYSLILHELKNSKKNIQS
jgi:hypothetical protein